MNKKTFAVLSISALVVALAAPLLAQPLRLTGNIPFEFVLRDTTMPAGEYSIDTNTNAHSVILRDVKANASVMSLAQKVEVKGTDPAAETKLVFRRYGDKYFLSEVDDGWVSSGLRIPISKTERELAKTASTSKPETLTVLAWLR